MPLKPYRCRIYIFDIITVLQTVDIDLMHVSMFAKRKSRALIFRPTQAKLFVEMALEEETSLWGS